MNDRRNVTTPSNSTSMDQTLARAEIYRWLSYAFMKPQDPSCSAERLREALKVLEPKGIKRFAELSQEKMISEFPRLFGHNLTPDSPPYETQYGSAHIFWQSQQLADINGFYRAFGLELKETTHERLDHIAVELEFISYLALKEAYAMEQMNSINVEISQDTQRKFLKDHLGKWVNSFRDCIQKKLPASAYARVADFLVWFIAWDCQRLSIQPEPLLFNEKAQRQEPTEEGCLPAPCDIPGQARLPCEGPGGPGCA